MSQRNFLRRQVIKYTELDGLRKGLRVSALVDNQLEQGTVKWIGTIKGTMYIGIEFERPVGNQFPETNGAPPFSCLVSHTRLVFPEDVKKKTKSRINATTTVSANEKKERSSRNALIMEQGEQHQKNQRRTRPEFHDSSQDEDNYCLLQKVSCLCLRDEECPSDEGISTCSSSTVAGSCDHERSSAASHRFVIMNHHQHNHHHHQKCQQKSDRNVNEDYHESDYVNVAFLRSNNEFDAEFVPTSPSSSSSVSPVYYGSTTSGGSGDNAMDNEKLTTFYKLCSQTRRLLKEYQVKFEELPALLGRIESDFAQINFALEKLKGFRSEAEDRLGEQLERCKLNMETVLRYSEIVLPSTNERKMAKEIYELEQAISSFDEEICGEIEALRNFSVAHQNLQECLQERLNRFTVIKTRLVQVERNLVKDESGLNLRLKGIQSILSVLERDHPEERSSATNNSDESGESSSDINKLLIQIQPYDYIVDTSKLVTQSQDLIHAEKQLLQEVKMKRVLLLDAKEAYSKFLRRLENFQFWYNDFTRRLSATRVTGPDFDILYPSLVTEREEKRQEFLEILASARNLRASIFDSSAVNKKVEDLQDQWKVLVDRVYRARSRKTV